MGKVTSKLQVTIPKSIAKAHGTGPGTEILFESAGDSIRVHRVQEAAVEHGSGEEGTDFRLRLFDEAAGRQRAREGGSASPFWHRNACLRSRMDTGGTLSSRLVFRSSKDDRRDVDDTPVL